MHVASINVTRNAHVHIGQSNLRKPIYDNDSHDNDNDNTYHQYNIIYAFGYNAIRNAHRLHDKTICVILTGPTPYR